jgi:hypothetical protein
VGSIDFLSFEKKQKINVDNIIKSCYNKYNKRKVEVNKMTRWEMLDLIIRKYGFEVEETIEFAFLCENGTEKQIEETFKKLME